MGLMKYITCEWWMGCQSPAGPSDAGAPARYEQWLEDHRDRLPRSLIDVPGELDWHDAHLRSLDVDTAKRTCTMRLDAYQGSSGGRRVLEVEFQGVSRILSEGSPSLGLSGPYGWGDLGYVEFDVAGEELEWRGLFSNGIELMVRFKDLSYRVGDVVWEESNEREL